MNPNGQTGCFCQGESLSGESSLLTSNGIYLVQACGQMRYSRPAVSVWGKFPADYQMKCIMYKFGRLNCTQKRGGIYDREVKSNAC